MTNNTLQNAIEYWYNSTDDNIVGVNYGYKESYNLTTPDLSIKFIVKQKKSLSELSPNEILPQSININGKSIITDVVQSDTIISINTCEDPYNPGTMLLSHKQKHRPLIGGISIGATDINGAGTLGTVCVDSIDNTYIGLSNNHVIVGNRNGFINSDRNDDQISSILDKDIIQPAKKDDPDYINNIIGVTKRYQPLYKNDTNYIDAAIVSLKQAIPVSFNQHNLNLSISGFATSEEINSLLSPGQQKILFKSSRTTGSSGGYDCPIVVSNLFASTMVAGYIGCDTPIDFGDLIFFRYLATDSYNRPLANVCMPGDSGSVLITDFNGSYKIVGLVFAGGTLSNKIGAPYPAPVNNMGVACRIDRVCSSLDISFSPNSNTTYSNPTKWSYVYDQSNSNAKQIVINNETYWQIGKV